ncbi:unnamed protein product, partial [Notodromas monacha]
MTPTADLYDAHEDSLQVATPMFQSYGAKDAFFGEIFTIKCHEDNSLVAEQVKVNGQGKVLVVDGGGSLRCALLGDNLADSAVKNGWSGLIIYGCIRDSKVINGFDLGVKALNTNPKKTVKRNTGLLNEPVRFADVTFTPGHFVYADSDGIVVSQFGIDQ